MKEVWKDILNFEGYYQVSNLGRVRSLDRTIWYRDGRVYKHKGKLLSLKKTNNPGYRTLSLSVNGKVTYKDVHRIVAETFLENPMELPCVNHINGVKTDNEVGNLEWCTTSSNCKHALDLGLTPSGEECSWSKLKNNEVLEIYELTHNSNLRHKQIAEMFGVTKATISKIKLGTNWSQDHRT